MKAIIFQFQALVIHVNVEADFCQIFRYSIPIWCGTHIELMKLLEAVNDEHPN